MKEKILKLIGIIVLVLMFVAVIVTSILINNKKKDVDKIPDTDQSIVQVV